MGWTSWARKVSDSKGKGETPLAVDLNSSRLRVMSGDGQRAARNLVLDEPHEEFALAAAFVGRTPEFGQTATAIQRQLPHVFVTDFLNDLSLPKRIEIGRHRLTPAELLTAILQRIRQRCPRVGPITAVLPPYLTSAKVTLVGELLERCQFTLRGSAVLPLALVAAWELPDRRPCGLVVIDCDIHALTISLIYVEPHQASLLHSTTLPRLNQRVWKNRLLAGISDRCVRVCRRDPRDTGATEQAVFDQLDAAMIKARDGESVELIVRSSHWYQTLRQSPEELASYCQALVRAVVSTLTEVTSSTFADPPAAVWLTHSASLLPGLLAALEAHTVEGTRLLALPVDAGCRAALQLASRWSADDLPRSHRDMVLALPEELIPEAMPRVYRAANAPPVPPFLE